MSSFDVDEIIYTKCPCGKGQVETQIGTSGHCWSMERMTKHKINCAECEYFWQFNWKDELIQINKQSNL